jgi:hypothetical protein
VLTTPTSGSNADFEAPGTGSSDRPKETDLVPSRKHLAELLQNPPPRLKKAKAVIDPDDAEAAAAAANEQTKVRQLDHAIRWMVLCYHSNKFAKSIVKKVYGNDIDPDSVEYTSARTKVYDNVRAYKSKMLNNMVVSSCLSEDILLRIILINMCVHSPTSLLSSRMKKALMTCLNLS